MSLARYKISEQDFPKAIKYLQDGAFKNKTPNWVVKNKQFLQVIDGKVRFNNLPIIPSEKINDHLRKLTFGKDSRTPLSRDGMFHKIKTSVAGISRRAIMDFLRGQSVIIKGKPAVPVPKGGGVKLKNYHIEFDLVFLKKRDVVKANKYFEDNKQLDGDDEDEDEENKDLTYIVSVVEKITGLTRLDWVKSKHAPKVTAIVIRLMKSIAAALKTPLSQIEVSSDSGTEFTQKSIAAVTKSYKRVPTGPSVEKKNGDIQRTLFQMLRARRGKNIRKLIQTTEEIVNNNYNKIQKKTPQESVEEEKTQNLKKYNDSRVAGEEGKKLEIGDWVRIRKLKTQKNKGLGYKSYKDLLWTKQVFRISSKTKNVPAKYRVKGKWYLTGMLMKSLPIDQKSEEIIQKRDEKEQLKKDKAHAEHVKQREKQIQELKAKKAKKMKKIEEKVFAPGGIRRSRRTAAILGRQKKLEGEKERERQDKKYGL